MGRKSKEQLEVEKLAAAEATAEATPAAEVVAEPETTPAEVTEAPEAAPAAAEQEAEEVAANEAPAEAPKSIFSDLATKIMGQQADQEYVYIGKGGNVYLESPMLQYVEGLTKTKNPFYKG